MADNKDSEMWWPSQQSLFNVPAAFSPALAAQQAQWWYQQALQQQQQAALPLPLVGAIIITNPGLFHTHYYIEI